MSSTRKNIAKGSIIEDCYVVQISDDVTDKELEAMCRETMEKAHSKNLKGVIFSFINVDIIDCYSIDAFIKATKMIELLGTQVVWSGLKPGVVSTILDFNIKLQGIRTCFDVNESLRVIKHI